METERNVRATARGVALVALMVVCLGAREGVAAGATLYDIGPLLSEPYPLARRPAPPAAGGQAPLARAPGPAAPPAPGGAAGPSPAIAPGVYVAIIGGFNLLHSFDFEVLDATATVRTVDASFAVGEAVMGAIGYDFGKVWRLGKVRIEAEIGYRTNPIDDLKLSGDTQGGTGRAWALNGGVNIYHDFVVDPRFHPYIGVGVGGIGMHWSDFTMNQIEVLNETTTGFAFQAMVGASYWFTPSLAVSAEYRYLLADDTAVVTTYAGGDENTKANYTTDSFMIGLRYRF